MHGVVVALALCALGAHAQSFPSRPVRMVIPYAAGGAVDAMARVFAPRYSEILGQPVIIENRAGAGGNIGSEIVAKSAPDGLTWLFNTSGQAIAPALYKRLNYDALKDLVPVSTTVAASLILVTPPQLPVKNIRELIALAKAQPGKLNFGSTGIGSGPQLAQELFKSMTGIDVTHVPYKGDAPLFPALFTNEVQFAVVPSQTALAHIRSGKVRALAVTNEKRASALPDVPTVAESGVPGYEYGGWTGFFVSGGTPEAIVRRISEETARIVKMPDVEKFYPNWGVEWDYRTPEEFAARYRSDIEKYRQIIRDAKIPQVDG
jgi:tripartite-type tricarboxylate transporter receptor subunit TctC